MSLNVIKNRCGVIVFSYDHTTSSYTGICKNCIAYFADNLTVWDYCLHFLHSAV